MLDMWKDFSFKKLGVPMKGLFILIIITVVIWFTLMLWDVVDPEGMGNFFWGKYEPQTTEAPIEADSGTLKMDAVEMAVLMGELSQADGHIQIPVPMPPFLKEKVVWKLDVMLQLPFKVGFLDEKGDFLGTFEIRNVKNKRVQIFWNGLATSVFFPIGKKNKKE